MTGRSSFVRVHRRSLVRWIEGLWYETVVGQRRSRWQWSGLVGPRGRSAARPGQERSERDDWEDRAAADRDYGDEYGDQVTGDRAKSDHDRDRNEQDDRDREYREAYAREDQGFRDDDSLEDGDRGEDDRQRGDRDAGKPVGSGADRYAAQDYDDQDYSDRDYDGQDYNEQDYDDRDYDGQDYDDHDYARTLGETSRDDRGYRDDRRDRDDRSTPKSLQYPGQHHGRSSRSAVTRSGTSRSGTSRSRPKRLLRRLRLPGGLLPWAVAGATVLALDWQLSLAAIAGGGVAIGAYRLRSQDWQRIDRWLRGWTRTIGRGENGKLAIAIGGGSTAMLSLYLSMALVSEANGSWLATATVLQGLGTLVAIALLARQWLVQPALADEERFDRAIEDLSQTDALKQLSAARAIGRLAETERLDRSQRVMAADCVRLLLARDLQEPVRAAALETLGTLEPDCPPAVGHRRPLPIRLAPKRSIDPPPD